MKRWGKTGIYKQFLPNTSRMDYLSGMIYNHGYVLAVEKLAGIEVAGRAQYIRVICSELNRISSHLLWFGTYVMDLGGFTPFLYAFDDREQILDILDSVSGSRLTYSYCRFGGVTRDVDGNFVEQTRAFVSRLAQPLSRLPQPGDQEHHLHPPHPGCGGDHPGAGPPVRCTGPNLRACGIPFDTRKTEPYEVYDRFDFESPWDQGGMRSTDTTCGWKKWSRAAGSSNRPWISSPTGPPGREGAQTIKPPKGKSTWPLRAPGAITAYYIVSDGDVKSVPVSNSGCRASATCSILAEILPGTLVADSWPSSVPSTWSSRKSTDSRTFRRATLWNCWRNTWEVKGSG